MSRSGSAGLLNPLGGRRRQRRLGVLLTSLLVFWLVVVLLLALTLARVLPALWRRRDASTAVDAGGANVAVYRDQLKEAERDLAADLITPERLAQTRTEIQRRVLEDTASAAVAAGPAQPSRKAAWSLLLLIPLASVATYLVLGSPQLIGGATPQADHPLTATQVETMLTTLAQRLQDSPDDAPGWQMLGRSYLALERFDDAIAALRKGLTVQPDNADMLTDLADAIARTSERQLAGEPTVLLARALEISPQHGKALALAGSAAFSAGDFAQARERWQQLLGTVPPDSEVAKSIAEGIARASAQLGGAAAPAAGPATPGAAAGKTVSGRITLAPALAARAAPGDTVFVYARAAEGPKAPLAIVRKTVAELPLSFTLDDTMAMTPALKLSGFDQVVIVARVSKSGQAGLQSGDLIGQSAPLAPGAGNVQVVIDTVQP